MDQKEQPETNQCTGCNALAARLAEKEELLLVYRENVGYHRQVIQSQQQAITELQAELHRADG